jgi:hypothetical protein
MLIKSYAFSAALTLPSPKPTLYPHLALRVLLSQGERKGEEFLLPEGEG